MTTEAATGAAVGWAQNAQAALEVAVTNSIQKIVTDCLNVIPGLIAAIIIFAVGWIIAVALARIVELILKLIRFEELLEQHKVEEAMGKVKVSNVLVKLSKYYVLLIFLQAAVSLLQLGTISKFLSDVLIYAPVLIGAALLVVVGALLGELIKEKIVEIEPKSTKMGLLGKWSKYLIVFIAVLAALEMAQFKVGVIIQTYTIILQGIVFGVALAFAIAFGLGAQEDAKAIVKDLKGKLLKPKA